MMLLRLVAAAAAVLVAGPAGARVEIAGAEGRLLENVQDYLGDQPDCAADAQTVDDYARQLPERLQPALDAFGHYRAGIDVERLPPADDCWLLHVSIDPGTPVTVRDISLDLRGEAREDRPIRSALESFPLARGSPLRHDAYLRFKDALAVLARQRGYFEGRFSRARIDVYVDEGAADIELAFDSGPRYSFGEITFRSEVLSARVLDAFVGFDEGDPYDAELVGRLQRDLLASEYFADASVSAYPEQAERLRVPLRVQTVPAESTSYSIGVGFSTDDGPRLRLSYDDRRRNRAGHQLQSDLLLSDVRQYVTFDYRIPIGNPQRDWRSLRAGLVRDDLVAGVGAGARIGMRRTRVGELLTVTRSVDALLERDELAGREFSSQLLVPGITWFRNQRDDLLRPREGYRASLSLAAGLGADVTLLQLDLQAKWITALPWEARVLVRGRVGATLERESLTNVPLSMLFFAGGDNSIRGYDYQSLGPRDPLGELVGGNRLIEASVEYEHPILEDWSIAAFVDSGNAFIGSDFEPRTGAGFGARWFSPLGPVRLDLAWPLDGDDRSPEVHLSLGPDL